MLMKLRRPIFALMTTALALAAMGDVPAAPTEPAGQQQTRKLPTVGTMPQEILLTKVTVSDLLKSYVFYTQVIGLKLVTSKEIPLSKAPTANDPEKELVEIPLNFTGSMADPVFLLIKQRGAKPSPEFSKMVVVGFKVENSKALIERAAQAGYKPMREVSVGGARVAYLADPDGYTVEVF
jgi:catechol 2,3-dioxygenase-like lactoylglutathione lyase family enzyme